MVAQSKRAYCAKPASESPIRPSIGGATNYINPKLQASISPELKNRIQGKSCFNFTKVEPERIADLKNSRLPDTKLSASGLSLSTAPSP
jgi:hypothetical protein